MNFNKILALVVLTFGIISSAISTPNTGCNCPKKNGQVTRHVTNCGR